MAVNEKKNIRVKNNTNYCNPEYTRFYNEFQSPDTYGYRQSKIEGYENRLYYQFKWCEDHDGQSFFYTLTYNDRALPRIGFGKKKRVCFDYEDLRDFLTGGFRKKLLREYGSTFKYFIGAELGDGKGKRGLENNPHYHALLFIENANNPRFPYKKITEKELTHLVRLYWQGFDEDTDGYTDYQEAKYGIVGVSDEGALVKDFRAEKYCGKYVCKDLRLKRYEIRLRQDLKFYYESRSRWCRDVREAALNSWFAEDLELKRSINTLAELYTPVFYKQWSHDLRLKGDLVADVPYYLFIDNYVVENKLQQEWKIFVDNWVADNVRLKINEYRNRYCNKCRCSQGLGDYALQFISNPLEPRILLPDKNGLKMRPIGMYYYRKLFCDTFKDPKGQNLYVLNDLGRQYKLHNAPRIIARMAKKAKSNFSVLNEALYDKMLHSDINTTISFSLTWDRLNAILKNYEEENNNKDKIFEDYGTYKLIYENRYCKLFYSPAAFEWSFPFINPLGDYERFLTPGYLVADYRPGRIDRFLTNVPEDYVSYDAHPYFLPNIRFFAVLDLLTDYLAIQKDNKQQTDAEEIAEQRRFHTKLKLQKKLAAYNNFLK